MLLIRDGRGEFIQMLVTNMHQQSSDTIGQHCINCVKFKYRVWYIHVKDSSNNPATAALLQYDS